MGAMFPNKVARFYGPRCHSGEEWRKDKNAITVCHFRHSTVEVVLVQA